MILLQLMWVKIINIEDKKLLFNRRRRLKHIINSDKFESDNLFEEVGL